MGSDKKVRVARKMITASDITAECAAIVQQASLPLEPREHINRRIERAAARLQLSFSQAKRFWYLERREVAAHEYLTLKMRLDELQRSAEEREELIDEIRAKVGSAFPHSNGDDSGSLVETMRSRGKSDRG